MIDELATAMTNTARIVEGLPDARTGDPTPCPDMDVRALVNHVVAGNLMFAAVARGEPLDLSVFGDDQLGDDAGTAYRASAAAVEAAWRRPGALDEELAFGGMPGAVVIRLHLTEELVHGWDLARSTGQDPMIDPRLAAIALEAMRQVPTAMLRGATAFGNEVAVGPDAPVDEQLVAFLGRDPAAWPRD